MPIWTTGKVSLCWCFILYNVNMKGTLLNIIYESLENFKSHVINLSNINCLSSSIRIIYSRSVQTFKRTMLSSYPDVPALTEN